MFLDFFKSSDENVISEFEKILEDFNLSLQGWNEFSSESIETIERLRTLASDGNIEKLLEDEIWKAYREVIEKNLHPFSQFLADIEKFLRFHRTQPLI